MKFIKKIIREFFRLINQLLSLARSDYVIIKKQDPNQNSLIKNVENEYNDYWIIMPLSAFGDSLVVFKLIKEFKKNRGGKVVVISNQERILKLARMFPDIDETKLVSSEFYENKLNTVSKIKLGKVFSCHFYFREFLFNKLSKNMLARSRDFLGITDDIYGESPVISAELISEANKIINHYKLENQKIVLISPFATTMNSNSLSKDFWSNMARTLEKKGYKVVFNSNILSENNNQEFINIFSDINVMVAFANICNAIIGVRSGILDVFRDATNVKMFVIYNHNHSVVSLEEDFFWDEDKSPIENYINCCSLKTMYKNNNTVELIYDGNENILEQQIIKNF
jgi:ADP-heptose:LPS heptosyltransferase